MGSRTKLGMRRCRTEDADGLKWARMRCDIQHAIRMDEDPVDGRAHRTEEAESELQQGGDVGDGGGEAASIQCTHHYYFFDGSNHMALTLSLHNYIYTQTHTMMYPASGHMLHSSM